MQTHRPRIAVTLGDPAGIGPEIVARAWAQPEVHQWCRPIAVGQPEVLRRAVELCGTGAEVVTVDAVDRIEPAAGLLPCIDTGPD
jgi:4-phospho-D-threonate 3-dehydrogenase / 4-phospho-D-erythronate 3-dehydrogenase